MGKDYTTEDGAQIAPLSDLKDFQVSEGYKDIRGWRVDSADGKEVGKVHDLLVDLGRLREDEAHEVATELAYGLAKRAYRL